MRANEIYSKNRKEKKMTDKETNFLKELDLLYQQDEEVSLDLMLELYENFEPFKIEAEKTGEGKEDEVRELYYKIGDRYFFLRVLIIMWSHTRDFSHELDHNIFI